MRERIIPNSESSDCDPKHKQTRPANMKQDEPQATKIVDYLTLNMTDPFFVDEHPDEIINISSGVIASKEVQKSLLTAIPNGTDSFHKFLTDRLTTDAEKPTEKEENEKKEKTKKKDEDEKTKGEKKKTKGKEKKRSEEEKKKKELMKKRKEEEKKEKELRKKRKN